MTQWFGCDPSCAIAGVLLAIATLVSTVRIKHNNQFNVNSNLYTIIGGAPGSCKSPPINAIKKIAVHMISQYGNVIKQMFPNLCNPGFYN